MTRNESTDFTDRRRITRIGYFVDSKLHNPCNLREIGVIRGGFLESVLMVAIEKQNKE
jgi:hypothetical protein